MIRRQFIEMLDLTVGTCVEIVSDLIQSDPKIFELNH
jgi:hypothetical protein